MVFLVEAGFAQQTDAADRCALCGGSDLTFAMPGQILPIKQQTDLRFAANETGQPGRMGGFKTALGSQQALRSPRHWPSRLEQIPQQATPFWAPRRG
jgi:hypothetical protein